MPPHGTWQQTGGGSGEVMPVLALGALAVFAVGGGAAAVTGAVEGILRIAAVAVGVLCIAGAVLVIWRLRTQPAREALAARAYAARVQAYELEQEAKRQARRRADAQIRAEENAALAASVGVAVVAAITQQRLQPQWSAQPVPVIRREVGR